MSLKKKYVIVLFIILIFNVIYVFLEQAVLRCYSSSPWDESFDSDGNLFMKIYHISNYEGKLEVMCWSNSPIEDLVILIYNDTMKQKFNMTYNIKSKQFVTDITENIFGYDPRNCLFFLPKWSFQIFDSCNSYLKGTVSWISKELSSFFTNRVNYAGKPQISTRSFNNADFNFSISEEITSGGRLQPVLLVLNGNAKKIIIVLSKCNLCFYFLFSQTSMLTNDVSASASLLNLKIRDEVGS